jgi:predicted DCC family thiol-disulfide oxidoreductase YuxK
VATFQSDHPILLYDGSCGFCARSVQFLLRHEGSRHDLRFAPLAGVTGRRVRDEHPELEGADSMVWYEPPRPPLVRSAAVIRAARYLGGGWSLLGGAGSLVPRPIRDWVYRQIARHRHRIPGPACVIPTAEERPRFLDGEDS